jgi:hypothetical protein
MVGYDRCEGRSGGAKGLFLEAAQCRIRRALVALALRWGLATEDSAATVGLLTHKTAGAASRRMSGGFAAGACWVQRLSRQATAETVLEGAALVGQVWLE